MMQTKMTIHKNYIPQDNKNDNSSCFLKSVVLFESINNGVATDSQYLIAVLGEDKYAY